MGSKPSNTDLLNDLQEVADDLGETPTIDQYKTHGSYTPWQIRSQFGSWTDAKEEAGLPVNRSGSKHYANDEALIEDIQRVAEEVQESPTARQYQEKGEYSLKTIQRRFGGWNKAKQEADLETYSNTGRKKYTDEELLNDLQRVAEEIGKSPTFQQYRSEGAADPCALEDRFGSWNKAKKRANLKTHSQHGPTSYDDEQEVLDDLREVATRLDDSPSVSQYRTHGEYPVSACETAFGSFNNAKEQAGLDIYPPDEFVPAEELLADLQQTADLIGTSPSKKQYNEWGTYTAPLFQDRFGSWNDAIKAANLEPNIEIDIPEDRILDDIKAVASIVGDTPSVDDYREHGKHTLKPVYRHFGSWVDALTAAGHEWVPYEYSDLELLESLRDAAESKYSPRRSEYTDEWGHTGSLRQRFGSWWAACVMAGLLPRRRRPLSPAAIHEYHQAALDLEPHYRAYALLIQFTGLPTRLVAKFESEWDTDRQNRNIIRVPAEETKAGDPWLFQYPKTWLNPHTGEREPTGLPEALGWFTTHYDQAQRSRTTYPQIIKRVASQGNLEDHRRIIYHSNIGYVPDVSPEDLRITLGVNLVEQGVERDAIRRRLGLNESNWGGEVEDFCLWTYVHRDYEPQNYDPPDVVLDPIK